MAENCIGCGDQDNGPVTARKAITIKIKVIALIPTNGAEGAFEAVAQRAVTDALSVSGALIERVTSKTKPT